MFGLKSTLLFVFVALRFAPSYQKPLDDVDTNRKVSDLQSNDGKVNNSGVDGIPMAMERTRSSVYPNSNGLGYYSIGQMQVPVHHYPLGMLNQPYQTPVMNSMYKNEEAGHADPRTLGHLRPTAYSQYQSSPLTNPQLYSYQAQNYHAQPYSYDYSSPVIPGMGSHYSGYSSYPAYYRDAEEEPARQFANVMSSEKYISPVRPGVQYTTKYLTGKPYENMDVQLPIMQPMVIRNAMPAQWLLRSSEAERGLMVDDQLQMQIPSNYLSEKIQHYALPNDVQSTMLAQPMMSRAAEESKPMEWNPQMFLNQPSNGDFNQQMQDPYLSPKDTVYMEPYTAADPAPLLSSRSMDLSLPMTAYPNHEQQLRIAQMQFYHNAMNNLADQIEPINKEYVNQRKASPNFQPMAPMDPAYRGMYLNNQPSMGTRSSEEKKFNVKELSDQFDAFRKNFEAYLETSKTENKNTKTETPKEEKKDQSAAPVKPSDFSATANGSKRT